MRHLHLAVFITLMYFSWNAFAQLDVAKDGCGFSDTKLGKEAAMTKFIETAGVKCKAHPGFTVEYEKWNQKLIKAREKEYHSAEKFFKDKSSTGCTSGFNLPVDAYTKWVTKINNIYSENIANNYAGLCTLAVTYINQKMGKKTASLEVQEITEKKPIQLASVDTRPEPVVEKPVRREQTAAVAVSTSSSYRSSGSLSGPSSLAYTSAYSNLLPTGYQQPMFVQMMVNQMVFVPGVGYRPILQPVIVPLRQGVR